MLVALKEDHRRCEQYLEQNITIEKNKVVQTLGQSRSNDIFEKVRTEYIRKKERLEEKHLRKLYSLDILPSR